jgi:hypothetical protein
MLSPLMGSVFAQLKARASGSRKHPLRFVFLMKSNGLWAENIQPQGLENRLPFEVAYDKDGRLQNGNHGGVRKKPTPGTDLQLDDEVSLSTVMQPLETYRRRVSILQGIAAGFSVYHKGHYQGLGAFAAKKRDTPEAAGPTIDSVLARAFPAPVPHVCLGHDPKAASGVSYITTSAAGPGKPLPFYTKPQRAYKELFGVVGEGDAKNEYDTQSDILDFFVDDSRRLRAEVAGPEREQLDRYLGAFESLRKSRREIEAMSDQLRKYAPSPPGEIDAQATTKIGAGNVDIAIAALASGLTNVVTIAFDRLSSSSYGSLGVGGLHGSVGHGQGGDVAGKRQRICGFHFQQMARLAEALDAIPECEGSMLDNTAIIYTSDNGETHHSSGVNWPIAILGNLGGRLAQGRYFAPGNDHADQTELKHVRLGDVWSTLLAASGQPHADFGQPRNGIPHKPIESLLS